MDTKLVIRSKEHQQELSGIGARESEMDVKLIFYSLRRELAATC